jgi:hypothetical protein
VWTLVVPSQAIAQTADPLDTVPELIGLRLRRDIPVTLHPGVACGEEGAADHTEALPSSDVPVLRWEGGPVRWSIGTTVSGEGDAGSALLPKDLPVGVHRVCVTSESGSATVDLKVEAPPYTQISITEIALDGYQRGRGVSHTVVPGPDPMTSNRWISSDFLRTDQVHDEHGRELVLYRDHDFSQRTYTYQVDLAEPAAPGTILALETRATAEPYPLLEVAPSEFVYEFNHSPNSKTVTRRIEVFRLPAGAVALDAGALTTREREGRVELVHVASIPPGGAVRTTFRYRAEGGRLGLPGPHVVDTVPPAGAVDVDPTLSELRVTFDADMHPRSWSWVQADEAYPKTTGSPRYVDARTCVMPVRLKPDTEYVVWINGPRSVNFRDTQGRSAKPYELRFHTAARRGARP